MAAIGHDFTHKLLVDAGIGRGMAVLDIGCGTGEVTRMVADLVGRQGAVTGVDREAGPLAIARARDLPNVTFRQGDIRDLPPELGLFDAIVGRRVLMYQPDTVRTVRQLAQSLVSDGLMIFHEHDTTMAPASLVPMPLHQRLQEWMQWTIEREGADIHIGFNLHRVLTEAGLSVAKVRAEAIVQTPGDRYAVGAIIRAMLPRIVRLGVATEQEIDIDTLDQRLEEERMTTNTTYVGDVMFGAWARKPR